MNAVDTVLAQMIDAYPSLRASRMDALLELATKSPEYRDEAYWGEDGNVVLVNCGRSPEKVPEEEDSVLSRFNEMNKHSERSLSYRVAKSLYLSDLLYHRRAANEAKFIRDNVDIIVATTDGHFEQAVPGSALRFLDAIPANANPLWIEAFVAMAREILYYKFPAGKFDGYIESYRTSYEDRLRTAKKSAQEFLTRIKGTDVEKVALAKEKLEKKIEVLRAEASQAGLTLEATVA